MEKKTRELLELVVEKAEKLRTFNFDSHVHEAGLGFHAERQADGSWTIELGLPDEKERDAFILTFRFFHQQNEATSFNRILDVANDPAISIHWQEEVARLRGLYFDFLDCHSDYTVNLFEGQPTRAQMLDIGLYGGLAHANRPNKVLQYRQWTRDELRAGLFHQEFARILVQVLGLIYQLSPLCSEELERDAG